MLNEMDEYMVVYSEEGWQQRFLLGNWISIDTISWWGNRFDDKNKEFDPTYVSLKNL